MSKEGLNGEQVRPIFIKMCTECMPEGMAGKAVRQSQLRFFCKDELVDGIGDHMPLGRAGHREKPSGGPTAGKPVRGEDIQCQRGKQGIAVGAGFGMADMNAHGGAADIVVAQGADLANPESGGIKEGQDCFVF